MQVLRRFLPYMRPYAATIFLVLVSTGLFVLFHGAAYWLSASFLSTLFTGSLRPPNDPQGIAGLLELWTAKLLVGSSREETLMRAAVAIVLAFTGKNLFGYLQLYWVSFVEQRVIKVLRDELTGHMLGLDLGFFQRRRRGDLISAVLNDVEQLNQALNKSFTKLIRDPINAVFLFVLLLSVSWKLTLVAALVVPALGWVVQLLSRGIKRHSHSVQELLADLTGQLQESLAAIRIVKAFGNERFEASRFQSRTEHHYRSAFARERLRRLVIPLNEVIGVLIFSAILYVGGELVLVRGAIDSSDFIRFLVLLFALLNPLLSLTNITANIRVAEASGQRVFSVLDSVTDLDTPSDPVKLHSFDQAIRFDGVSFRYAADLPDVLSGIDLVIERGERLAIVGRSGSGKSTLLNLLPRFLDPSQGSITIDGHDLRQLDLRSLRERFGIVTQEVILFHDSVAANIAYGMEDVSDERIAEAAAAANADAFIRELPEGYDTLVGEQGALFSGGQRQRISIARALLREPQIVLLDEATSSLDPESEQAVGAALDRLTQGRTTITVTHRLASARDADRIVLLDEGRIVALGNHETLLQSSELYRDLAERQKLVAESPAGEEG